jgi:hypothetical protein
MSLPHAFFVYRAPKSSSWSRTKTYHIGTLNASPVYTYKEAVSWSGKFTITLHIGSTTDGTLVASSSSGGISQDKAVITIPVAAQSTNGQGEGEIVEPFRRHVSLKHETWDFVLAVMTGIERQAEKFEWRRTHGDEIASLRGGKSTYGWKLVRLRASDSAGVDIKEDSRILGESSDGKEVVAVWTDDTQTWFRGDEKGVVGKLEFAGIGASVGNGGLGEQWKIFAMMSALHMRQVNLQYANTAIATTTAAASA